MMPTRRPSESCTCPCCRPHINADTDAPTCSEPHAAPHARAGVLHLLPVQAPDDATDVPEQVAHDVPHRSWLHVLPDAPSRLALAAAHASAHQAHRRSQEALIVNVALAEFGCFWLLVCGSSVNLTCLEVQSGRSHSESHGAGEEGRRLGQGTSQSLIPPHYPRSSALNRVCWDVWDPSRALRPSPPLRTIYSPRTVVAGDHHQPARRSIARSRQVK